MRCSFFFFFLIFLVFAAEGVSSSGAAKARARMLRRPKDSGKSGSKGVGMEKKMPASDVPPLPPVILNSRLIDHVRTIRRHVVLKSIIETSASLLVLWLLKTLSQDMVDLAVFDFVRDFARAQAAYGVIMSFNLQKQFMLDVPLYWETVPNPLTYLLYVVCTSLNPSSKAALAFSYPSGLTVGIVKRIANYIRIRRRQNRKQKSVPKSFAPRPARRHDDMTLKIDDDGFVTDELGKITEMNRFAVVRPSRKNVSVTGKIFAVRVLQMLSLLFLFAHLFGGVPVDEEASLD